MNETVFSLTKVINLDPEDYEEGLRLEIAIQAMQIAADTPLAYAERTLMQEIEWWQTISKKYKFQLTDELVFDPYMATIKVYEEVVHTW